MVDDALITFNLHTRFNLHNSLITFSLHTQFSLHSPVILLLHYCRLLFHFIIIPTTPSYTICSYIFMAPLLLLPSLWGGATRASFYLHWCLFGWHYMAYHFDFVPLEVRNDILHLETKEFGDHKYFFDSKISGSTFKWTLNPRKFHKRRLHFLHSVAFHCQLETFLHMVIHDKQVDNYQSFIG